MAIEPNDPAPFVGVVEVPEGANVRLDISPGPGPSLGAAELLLLFGCCALGLLLVGGGVAIALLVKRKKP